NFDESVNATTSSFTISCATSGAHTFTLSASPSTSFTLNPNVDFSTGELCTVTVVAAQVTDVDANDPPDNMTADYVFSFTSEVAPVVTTTGGTTTFTEAGGPVVVDGGVTVTDADSPNLASATVTITN